MSSNTAPTLVDHRGEPMASVTSHYGADQCAPELARWSPQMLSADGELLPEWGTLVARNRDMIRNHGLASGAVQIHLDNIIGAGLRLSAKPDWRALGLTSEWADGWSRNVESQFRQWAEDIDCYCDASRRLTFAGMLGQGYRSYLTSFEILASAEWLPRPGRFSTAIQMIDPDRLTTPEGVVDSQRLRAGVELDAMGAPIAYWIRSGGTDYLGYDAAMPSWKRVPRETPWGRRMMIHVFDEERPSQTRGKNGIVSVLSGMKMLEKFEQSSLQAAILNAMYAAVVESSMDWQSVGSAIGAEDDPTLGYMENRNAWHKGGSIRYNGVKIPHMFPGEKLKLLAPNHPTASFASFEEAFLRKMAGGFNLSYEQFSRDYSKSNYSSARAALLESWRFFSGRRVHIAGRFATQVFALWLEEAIDRGTVEIPPGAPSFYAMKTAWTRCKWIGPGRGHIDPLKEANATQVELDMGLTTHEKECAERGEDWEEIAEQRAREQKRFKELGIEPPPARTPVQLPPDDPESPTAPEKDE